MSVGGLVAAVESVLVTGDRNNFHSQTMRWMRDLFHVLGFVVLTVKSVVTADIVHVYIFLHF
jgi:hypothetical protein